MKKLLFSIVFLPSFLFSQAPAGYYDATNGLTGYTLKSKLNEIISKNYNWHYNDLRDLYFQTDLDHFYDHGAENTTIIVDVYSEKPREVDAFEYTRSNLIGTASAEGQGWNREHVMPQSTFAGSYPMYSDLFSVIPADAYINQLRSNYPYAKVDASPNNIFSNTSKRGKSATPGYTNLVYEPIDEFKGDIARILLYFAVRYEGKLGSFAYSASTNPLDGSEERAYEKWYITMLKEWNALDPVSDRERARNEAVYAIQKNRNPFVDNENYVNLIWNQTEDAVAPAPPINLGITKTSAYFTTLSWSASSDSDVLGYKIYKNGLFMGTSKSTTFSVDHLFPSTTYNFTVRAYDNSYNESANSNPVSVTTLASDIYAKDLMISKYLEGTENNHAIEIINKTGHEVNLSQYKINLQLRSSTYYFTDPFEFDGKLADGESIVIMHPNATFTCFTPAQADFVTNSPAMTFTGSQYLELSYFAETVDAVGVKDVSNSNSNVSLYRNSSVTQPNANFTMTEWDSYPSNYCTNLGVLANDEVIVADNKISIYPNPVTQGQVFAGGKEVTKIFKASIFDVSGKLIYSENNPFKTKDYIDVNKLEKGIYILVLDNQSFKFIKN